MTGKRGTNWVPFAILGAVCVIGLCLMVATTVAFRPQLDRVDAHLRSPELQRYVYEFRRAAGERLAETMITAIPDAEAAHSVAYAIGQGIVSFGAGRPQGCQMASIGVIGGQPR